MSEKWTIGVLVLGVLFWYSLISYRWFQSITRVSRESQQALVWMVLILVVCSMAAYVGIFLSLFIPEISFWIRPIFLAVQNVICPIFWFHPSSRRLGVMGTNEKIGNEMYKAVNELNSDELGDRELASLARRLVAESLKRMESGKQ